MRQGIERAVSAAGTHQPFHYTEACRYADGAIACSEDRVAAGPVNHESQNLPQSSLLGRAPRSRCASTTSTSRSSSTCAIRRRKPLALVRKLGLAAIDLVRTAEPEFEQHAAAAACRPKMLLDLLHASRGAAATAHVEIANARRSGRRDPELLR
jgi:hypothetical protein